MQITQITASYAATFNMGAYENIRIETSATATLDEGDDPAQAHADLVERCKRQTLIAAAPSVKRREKIESSIWEGLPDHLKKKYAADQPADR